MSYSIKANKNRWKITFIHRVCLFITRPQFFFLNAYVFLFEIYPFVGTFYLQLTVGAPTVILATSLEVIIDSGERLTTGTPQRLRIRL